MVDYYDNEAFARADKALLKAYRFKNPFRIAKRYYLQVGDDPYSYGETPLDVFETIGKALGLGPGMRVLDLGCGRGRGVFFLKHFFGCEAVGVEQVPEFVRIAKGIGGEFHAMNFLKMPLSGFDALYMAGTCFDDGLVEALSRKLERHTLKIATISYALEGFEVLDTIPIEMPWGSTELFIQKT